MKIATCFAKYYKILLSILIAMPFLASFILSTPALAAPAIELSPASGAIGTNVTIYGTVFDSYKGDNIYIFFDDTEIPDSPLTIDETGTFTMPFIIPDGTAAGRHWIEARSETKSTSMLAKNFFIVEEPAIKLDIVDGFVGTKVTISGVGFYAGRMVTFYYYNTIGEKLGTEAASSIGDFSYQFTIPNSTAGEHKVVAKNAEGDSAETDFEVIPSITLNLASAGPGELLFIRGIGFGRRAEVEINFGTYPAAGARADEHGNFEVQFNIPTVMPGTYDVKALDEFGNIDKAKFVTTAGASLDHTSGSVGSRVTVSGSGFEPGKTVSVDYDKLRVATATPDNNGAFKTSFNVPLSSSGNHVITVSDGINTKKFAYTVESQAPPVPVLLLPADSSETRAKAYLDWQDVTDPSLPVAYSLQVATDRNFSSPVLEKEGLTESEYTLTKEERLPAVKQHAPYYWRVKATDSANNQSEWSAPWSFYISAPPPPMPLLPALGSQAEIPVLINWQAVNSLSPPISYHLQVATDLNFTNIVLEKQGLVNSEYLITEEEALPEVKAEAPYYWRVKAIDNANNESEWSATWSFYTSSPFTWPGWATFTLIGIGVIVIGFFAFRVGRRTAFSPPG